jgi:hypothetical protein
MGGIRLPVAPLCAYIELHPLIPEKLMHQRNPFELMMNPAAVVEAMERSRVLAELNSRVYRPLDRHMSRDDKQPPNEVEAFDQVVEQADDTPLDD